MFRVAIQHSVDTGRYHPAFYRLDPMPGSAQTVLRFKSGGHHTEGFATVAEAQAEAADELAEELSVEIPEDGFPVRKVVEAGADVWLAPAENFRLGC